MAFSDNNNPYGTLDDAFETYIDMDFLRKGEDETGNSDIPTPNLFQYFFEGELLKDEENEASSAIAYQTPPLIPDSYNLISNPDTISEDQVKLTTVPVETIDNVNLLTQPRPQNSDLITPCTSVETSVSILNAQLAELLSKLQGIKQEKENVSDNKSLNTTTTNNLTSTTSHKPASRPTTSPKTSSKTSPKGAANDSQIPTDGDDQLDIKKLSSKERRQIRNKISARNFRVRRKEYIQNLESIKNKQEEEINVLKQALLHLQEENVQLKQEVEELRKLGQSNKLRITSPPLPPNSPATITPTDLNNVNAAVSKFNNNGNSNLQRNDMIKRSSSSLLTNVHQSVSPVSRQLVTVV